MSSHKTRSWGRFKRNVLDNCSCVASHQISSPGYPQYSFPLGFPQGQQPAQLCYRTSQSISELRALKWPTSNNEQEVVGKQNNFSLPWRHNSEICVAHIKPWFPTVISKLVSAIHIRLCVCYSVVSNCLQPYGLQLTKLPWNSPGKNTGVGCYSLLQRIFPTQGLNPVFLYCRQILYNLSHQESPHIGLYGNK